MHATSVCVEHHFYRITHPINGAGPTKRVPLPHCASQADWRAQLFLRALHSSSWFFTYSMKLHMPPAQALSRSAQLLAATCGVDGAVEVGMRAAFRRAQARSKAAPATTSDKPHQGEAEAPGGIDGGGGARGAAQINGYAMCGSARVPAALGAAQQQQQQQL